MSHLLTPHGVRTLMQPKGPNPEPITVQVIHMKQIPATNGDRYRVVVSDGEHFVQGMLSTQLNVIAAEGRLQNNGLLTVEDYMVNKVQSKSIVILLQASPLAENPGHRIGSPTDLELAPNVIPPDAGAAAARPLYNSTNNGNSGGGTVRNAYAKTSNNNNNNNMNVSPGSSYSSNPYGRSAAASSSSSAAPIVRSQVATSQYTPIKDLNLYQSRWTIQARVTHRSDIRTWSNAKGEGCLFSVDLLDSSGVDIRATFFKEAVERFHDMLQEGQVYTFSGGRLKVANARWNNCKSPHEITFDQNSEIHLSQDNNIQAQAFEFVESIASIETMPIEQERMTMIDVLAYVQHVGEVTTLISKKKGQEFSKCDATLVDDSNAQITLTLWSDQAHKAATLLPLREIVAVRRARLSEYNGGKTLGSPQGITAVNNDASLQQNPAVSRLQAWYTQTGGQGARMLSSSGGGGGGTAARLADRKQIADIAREGLGYQNEKGDYLSFVGHVTFLKKDKEGGAWYPACPNGEEPCRNRCKVTPSATGAGDSWHCERCNGTFDRCVRKWIFTALLGDESGSTWVTFFNEQAEQMFDGKTADEIYQQSPDGGGAGSDAYDSCFTKAVYTEWNFRAKVKNEMVNEEQRRKTQVVSMWPVNYVQESQDLLAAIASF